MSDTVPNKTEGMPLGSLVREIFAAALTKASAEERQRYLAEACKGDSELRMLIESLLQAHEKAGSFLDHDVMGDPTAAPLTERAGDRIDRYKLLEKVGEGAFGTVYVAEQEEPIRRRVAVKVIKLGMDTRQVVARFEAERQALAMMDHPNIAKVLDAGTTETGRPFFVMELVRGIRITDYCDHDKLSIRERLDLFIQVCNAVQHAHQKGIIHRDIKPSNILVTLHDGVPVPKVIDFGIAKAMEGRLANLTVYTELHQFIGTPAYMSPEQAEMSGLDIDTRSDIYSLGVLLYELLTGKTPFDPQALLRAGLDEMRRIIRDDEPVRPSTRLSTLSISDATELAKHRKDKVPALISLVRGDLDWIVMKTLEKDRTRRYETANGLAMDLKRHLNNEPIIARPPSKLYQFQKLVRRNKLTFAATATVIAALAGGIGVSSWQYLEEKEARKRAVATEKEQTKLRVEAEQLLRRTENAEKEAKERLLNSYLAQAHASRWSGQPGRRFDSLDALAKAAAMQSSTDLRNELRNEAIACLALPDMRIAKEWDGHPPATSTLAFDNTFENYARSDMKGEISIRRVQDDAEIVQLPGKGSAAWLLRFSPNRNFLGAWYQSGNEAGHAEFWDWRNAKTVFRAPLAGFAFKPDNDGIAVNQLDGALKIFDATSGKAIKHFATKGKFAGIAFSPDSRQLAACDATAASVQIFDVQTGALMVMLPHPHCVRNIAWHSDGKLLAAACDDFGIYVWDISDPREPIAVLRGHQGEPTALAFSHRGNLLASMSSDGTVRLWDPIQGKELVNSAGACRAGHPELQFSLDDERLAFASKGNAIGFWEINPARECVWLHSYADRFKGPRCVDFGPDGRLLASAHSDGVRLWDVSRGKELALLSIGAVNAVNFHPNGKSLITCGEDSGLDRWPIEQHAAASGAALTIGPPHHIDLPPRSWPLWASLAADGSILAVGDSFGEVILLDLENPTQRKTIGGHDHGREGTISPDNSWIASRTSGLPSNLVRVSNTASGMKVFEALAAGGGPSFSPDNRWLVTDHGDKFCVWETGSWKLKKEFAKQEQSGVTAFSQNGTILALSETPAIVKLFDVTRGWKEVAALDAPGPRGLTSARFTKDGGHLAISSEDHAIRVWDLRLIRSRLAAIALDWNAPHLADEKSGATNYLTITVLGIDNSRSAENRMPRRQVSERIQHRDPRATENLLDLTHYYNALLTESWHQGGIRNNLATLPRGLQTFAGVTFDVRGLIQLGGESHSGEKYPDRVDGIPVRRECRRLHFLHAAINARVRKGTQIGSYLVHYADGQQQEIPIVVGKDLADWWKPPNEPKAASVEVWEGTNEASREEGWTIRLFKTAWENPLDEIAVKSIDFLAADFIASPFLVAITVE